MIVKPTMACKFPHRLLSGFLFIQGILLSYFLFHMVDGAIVLRASIIFLIFSVLFIVTALEQLRPFPYMIVVLTGVLTAFVSSVFFIYLAKPAIPGLLNLALYSLILLLLLPKRLKILPLGACVIFVAFGLAEVYLDESSPQCEISYSIRTDLKNRSNFGEFVISDKILGFAPVPNSTVSAKKFCDNRATFDALYTIDPNGRRVVPRLEGDAIPILFFGDSFAFGEGVSDRETSASFIQELSGWKYRVYNFGFNGYGPHHMFTILQNEMERTPLTGHTPKCAVYFAVFDPSRSAGRTDYDQKGPMYFLDDDSKLEFAGKFSFSAFKRMNLLLQKSVVYDRVIRPALFDKQDQKLFIQLIRQSSDTIKKRYGCKFIVILWESLHPLYHQTIARLKEQGIVVYGTSDILPKYNENWNDYIFPVDGHPIPATHKKVAEFLLRVIEN
jgi:hypothetical protein